MAETTSIWTWVSLGVGTVALFASVIVPGSIYFYDKSAAGVMTEDKIQKMNGAAVVKKEIEMTNNILNPAAILGGFKTAATEVANKKISDTTGAALNSVKEIGGGSSTEGGLEMPPISAKISDIPANISDIPANISDIPANISSIQTPDISSIQTDALNNVKNTMGSTKQDLLNTSFGNTKGQFDSVNNKYINTRGSSRNKIYGGGRKTKNNRKKTVQPKVKKPRTKKCLITKGDKMFMSFCI
jgi:hypothetical protein